MPADNDDKYRLQIAPMQFVGQEMVAAAAAIVVVVARANVQCPSHLKLVLVAVSPRVKTFRSVAYCLNWNCLWARSRRVLSAQNLSCLVPRITQPIWLSFALLHSHPRRKQEENHRKIQEKLGTSETHPR